MTFAQPGLKFRGVKLSRIAAEPRKFNPAKVKAYTIVVSVPQVTAVFDTCLTGPSDRVSTLAQMISDCAPGCDACHHTV